VPSRRAILRWGAPALYVVIVAVAAVRGQLSLSTDSLFLWIAGFMLACTITSPRRFLRGIVDWLPLVVVLLLYDLLRGAADGLLATPHLLPQIDVDRWLAGGQVPSAWLQQQLWHGPSDLHWWDWATLAVYITHFIATLGLAAALLVFAHDRFRRYMVMVIVLSLTGLATYALYPAIPPWMAAEGGHVPPLARIVPITWAHVHVFSFDTIFETGRRYANDVAAVPSLHAAFALLFSLTLWDMTRRVWVRALLVLYPLAMGAALVYAGEHYVADVLLGYVYAVATYAGVTWAARAWAARREPVPRAVRADGGAATPAPENVF